MARLGDLHLAYNQSLTMICFSSLSLGVVRWVAASSGGGGICIQLYCRLSTGIPYFVAFEKEERGFILLYRSLYLVSHLLHKLVLEGFKAVETDRGHVAVLHGDRPLGRLVLPQEREVLQHDMQLKRTRLWWKIPFGPCFLDSKNVSREFPKCIQEIRAASSVFGLGQRVQVIIHVVATVSVGKLLLRSEFENILDFVFGLV